MRLSRLTSGPRPLLPVLTGAFVFAAGCGDDNPADGGSPTGTGVVEFDHVVTLYENGSPDFGTGVFSLAP